MLSARQGTKEADHPDLLDTGNFGCNNCFIAAAAFVPFTISPTHSRIGRRLGETCKSESFVIF